MSQHAAGVSDPQRGDPRFAWPSPRFWQFVGTTVVGASFFLLWIVVLLVFR